MSNKISKLDFINTCKKFSSRKELILKHPNFYQLAYNNNWINELNQIFPSLKKAKTKQECIDDARKFETKKEWYSNSRTVYLHACKNGFLKECYKHFKPNKPKWDRASCLKEAQKYSMREYWKIGSRSSYMFAKKNGLMELCSKHMEKRYQFWTNKKCLSIAKQCKNLREWRTKSQSSLRFAKKRPTLMKKCVSHMKINFNSHPRIVYGFFDFVENYAYIGLTYNPKARFSQHLNEKTKLKESLQKGNLSFIELSDFLPENQAQKLEKDYIEYFKSQGFSMLNKAPAGSLGSGIIHFWTKEKCIKSAKKYKYFSDWIKECSGAVSAAYKNQWIKACSQHFIRKNRIGKYYSKWSLELCQRESKKYKTPYEWQKGSSGSWKAAYRFGWLKDCYQHMELSQRRVITKKLCVQIAKKYQTKIEWYRNDSSSYNIANRNDWMSEASAHMIILRKNNKTS